MLINTKLNVLEVTNVHEIHIYLYLFNHINKKLIVIYKNIK